MLWFGCNQVIDGKLDFGQLTSFLLLAIYAISSLGGLLSLFSAVMSALGVSRRIFELLDTHPTIQLEGGETIAVLRGHLQLADITFAYPSRLGVPVLNGVSISIEPGQTVALCGASGSSKSSIIALLQRWYDPTGGSLSVDGVPLAHLDASWWRRQIALVAQEPVLFSGTVLDNLRYGRVDASLEAASLAASTANAHDFIASFTEGYETVVGERGIALSGGQKQRIAIARALLVDPSVLLLDEATSALDAESEAVVQHAIDKLMEARTTLVIAHRLSTIRNAGCICVMVRQLRWLKTSQGASGTLLFVAVAVAVVAVCCCCCCCCLLLLLQLAPRPSPPSLTASAGLSRALPRFTGGRPCGGERTARRAHHVGWLVRKAEQAADGQRRRQRDQLAVEDLGGVADELAYLSFAGS